MKKVVKKVGRRRRNQRRVKKVKKVVKKKVRRRNISIRIKMIKIKIRKRNISIRKRNHLQPVCLWSVVNRFVKV